MDTRKPKHISASYGPESYSYIQFIKEYKMIPVNGLNDCNNEPAVKQLLDYYLTHEDKEIFKRTDYLCDKQEKICICNTYAENLRKTYEHNYIPQKKISFLIK